MYPVGRCLARLLGDLQELLPGAHRKHQGTDAFQFVTGEQPADSAYSLQSIWEVGETQSPQRGGSPGNPSGYHGYWCSIFSRWHCVCGDKPGGAEMGNLIVSRESAFHMRTHGIFASVT